MKTDEISIIFSSPYPPTTRIDCAYKSTESALNTNEEEHLLLIAYY